MPKLPSIVFMGTPDFAVPTLKALHEKFKVIGVYSQPPRPAGRGNHLQKSAVHQWAESQGLLIYIPLNFKSNQDLDTLRNLKPDLIVVVAYGLILPQKVLDIPPYGCINVHGSILPRWRGAAPIQRAILAGDQTTGVTIMKMDAGMDTGPVLAERQVPIHDTTTAHQLAADLSTLGATALMDVIAPYLDGDLKPTPQSTTGVTYASKIEKQELEITWTEDALYLERKIRALGSIWFPWHQDRIKILKAEVDLSAPSVKAGTVMDDQFAIACEDGILKPILVQKTGGKVLEVQTFLRGHTVPAGTFLPALKL